MGQIFLAPKNQGLTPIPSLHLSVFSRFVSVFAQNVKARHHSSSALSTYKLMNVPNPVPNVMSSNSLHNDPKFYPAALLPYPYKFGLRQVALRPALSRRFAFFERSFIMYYVFLMFKEIKCPYIFLDFAIKTKQLMCHWVLHPPYPPLKGGIYRKDSPLRGIGGVII